jgi:hypothetical protein
MVKTGTGMKTFPSNGSQTSRGENELAPVSRKFQELIDSCPSWVSPRQKVMTEQRRNVIFVQIVSSFKIIIDGDTSEVKT